MSYGYKQGQFIPRNKEKYRGSYPLVMRSSWEFAVARYLDLNPSIIAWGSESVIVKYKDPTRGDTLHRYFIDFNCIAKKSDGTLQKLWIEVKPFHETRPPVKGRANSKRYLNESMTYVRNQSKWHAAIAAANSCGAKFVILTEKDLKLSTSV